jgi:hypothetical protein
MERLVRFLFHETCHLNVFAFGLRCSDFGRYQLHSCETNSLIRNPAIHKRIPKNNHAAISPLSEPSVLLTSEIADLINGKQTTTKVNAATNAYHPCGLGMRLIFIFLANVLAHPRRDGSLKKNWMLVAVGWSVLFCGLVFFEAGIWISGNSWD